MRHGEAIFWNKGGVKWHENRVAKVMPFLWNRSPVASRWPKLPRWQASAREPAFRRLEDPTFQDEVRKRRSRILDGASGALASIMKPATRTLRGLLDDNHPSVQLGAARGAGILAPTTRNGRTGRTAGGTRKSSEGTGMMNLRIRSRLQRLEKTTSELRRDADESNLSMQQVMGAPLASNGFDEFAELARKKAMFGTLTADEQNRSENVFWTAMVDEFGPEMAQE